MHQTLGSKQPKVADLPSNAVTDCDDNEAPAVVRSSSSLARHRNLSTSPNQRFHFGELKWDNRASARDSSYGDVQICSLSSSRSKPQLHICDVMWYGRHLDRDYSVQMYPLSSSRSDDLPRVDFDPSEAPFVPRRKKYPGEASKSVNEHDMVSEVKSAERFPWSPHLDACGECTEIAERRSQENSTPAPCIEAGIHSRLHLL